VPSEPLPVAVDVVETEFAQPPELALHGEQAVRGILILERLADRREERQVQAIGWRGHMFEVGEHPARFEQVEDLAVERALSLVLEMVDGH
jgi:glycerol dehydrogenase-like iron-containing ADH family enzyme